MSMDKAFALAVADHAAGRLAQSEQRCREILAVDGAHVGALHLLAVLRCMAGHLAEGAALLDKVLALAPRNVQALASLGDARHMLDDPASAADAFRRAVALAPNDPVLWIKLGLANHDSRQWEGALQAFDRALALAPDSSQVYFSRGQTCQAMGQADRAIADYMAAIIRQPDHADAYWRLADVLRGQSRLEEAEGAAARAVALQPNQPEPHLIHGRILELRGQFDQAVAALRRVLALDPKSAEGWLYLGGCMMRLERFPDAIDAFSHALAVRPNWDGALNNLGLVYKHLGQLDMALECLDRAVAHAPDYAKAHHNRSTVLMALGRLDEAKQACERALALTPLDGDTVCALGCCLELMGQYDQAEAHYLRALTLIPDNVQARLNLAYVQLLRGDLGNGWQNHEYRRRDPAQVLAKVEQSCPQPIWQGQDLTGRTVLLRTEQGAGDAFQFVRFAPHLAKRGAKVVVECDKALAAILATATDVHGVVAGGELLPPFDYHVAMMSMPAVLGFSQASDHMMPIPYLRADAALAADWADRLASTGPGLRVGLVWSGNPRHVRDATRSMPADVLLPPLAALPGVRLFSLQKSPRPTDAQVLAGLGETVTDLDRNLTDYSQTAAVLTQLDLVITVDTSVAHLAGALGCAVWLLLPFVPDWRWMLGRSQTEWYPKMRLFRQDHPGQWGTVMDQVVAALGQEAAR